MQPAQRSQPTHSVWSITCASLFQSLINLSPNQRKSMMQASLREKGTVQRVAPTTLKDFSLQFFRYQEMFDSEKSPVEQA